MPKCKQYGIPGYNATSWGNLEFPLWQFASQCPSARYVGGVSKYLCECTQPMQCAGVKAAIASTKKEA